MCFLSLSIYSILKLETWKNIHCPGSAYHSTATLHVMEVSVSVGTEVHASSDPREWSALLVAQTAIWCPLFMFYLCPGKTGGTF